MKQYGRVYHWLMSSIQMNTHVQIKKQTNEKLENLVFTFFTSKPSTKLYVSPNITAQLILIQNKDVYKNIKRYHENK